MKQKTVTTAFPFNILLGFGLVLCVLMAFSYTTNAQKHKKESRVRYNGFYQSACETDSAGDEVYSYLRFYPDGQVINVTSTGKPADLKRWFNLKHGDLPIGEYQVAGSHISFAVTSKNGIVEYEGQIFEDSAMELNINSLINGYQSVKKYHFVKINRLEK